MSNWPPTSRGRMYRHSSTFQVGCRKSGVIRRNNLSVLQRKAGFPANHWIVAAVSGILDQETMRSMHRNWTYRLILTGGLVASLAHAQQSCGNGIRVDGTIADPTGAVIPGAQVRATTGETATTDTAGHY